MYIAPVDRTAGEHEWRPFLEQVGFGHLVAAGHGRVVPVVVPTQFILDGDDVVLHVAAPNPILLAIAEEPTVLLSVAGDWAFIPSDWKAIGGEDPRLGIPTTYYGAVQVTGRARVVDEPTELATLLRLQLSVLQPDVTVADPLTVHAARLRQIRGVRLAIDEVRAKFKYGGNVDSDHRRAVMGRLRARGGAGDAEAADHVARRLEDGV